MPCYGFNSNCSSIYWLIEFYLYFVIPVRTTFKYFPIFHVLESFSIDSIVYFKGLNPLIVVSSSLKYYRSPLSFEDASNLNPLLGVHCAWWPCLYACCSIVKIIFIKMTSSINRWVGNNTRTGRNTVNLIIIIPTFWWIPSLFVYTLNRVFEGFFGL